MQALLGLLVFIGLAWLLSERRRAFPWRAVAAGLALQFLLAGVMLGVPAAQQAFLVANELVLALDEATQAGTGFVFGYLGGAEPPFKPEGAGDTFILAFQALPLLLVVSALSAVLFYWRVLPLLIRGLAAALRRGLGIGGALGLGSAGNLFLGMVESPLLIRPYLQRMQRSELFALMATGMATLAGTMLVLYASIIGAVLDDALGTEGGLEAEAEPASGAMDALVQGTLRGLDLLLQIVALLVVVVALVALVNSALGLLPAIGGEALTLERILGWLFAPLAWLAGIPWEEAARAGSLLGTKTVLNEMLAFLRLADLPEQALSPHSERILVYALAGFANLGSLGILIGGLGGLVPERRREVVELGPRAVAAGTLATLMTGAVVGLLDTAGLA